MATYRITTPDGATYNVTAPDSAAPADVMAFAQNQHAKAAAQVDNDPISQGARNFTDDMSGVQKFVAGYGKAGVDLARGVGQLIPGLVSRDDVAESRKLDAPLMNTGAGRAGNITGTLADLSPTVFVPGAATLPGAAAVGATIGALQPSTSTKETLTNTGVGTLAGPAGVLVGRGLGALYQGGKALLEPFYNAGRNRIAGNVLDQFAADPAKVAAATGARTVTGAAPTLAEAAGDPGIAALQASLAQQDPKIAAALSQRAMDNNAARVGVVQNIAGDDASRVAADAARKSATAPLYAKASQAVVDVDPQLQALLQRPSVQRALGRAGNLASEQGRKFGLAAPTKGADVATVDAAGTPMLDQVAGQPGKITGQTLQDLKMAMDDMLKDPSSGIVGKEAAAVKSTRDSLVNWMENAIPEFQAAREGWAAGTKPINAMDVGQRLLDKTTAAVKDLGGNQKLQANAFSRALNDEQGLVRNATGFKGVNALQDVLNPQQQAAVDAVRNELELQANLASAANGPGSQTAKSLASQNLLRRLIGPTGMPQNWSESALLQSVVRPAQFAMKTAEPKIQNRIAEILLNPDQAAAAMQMARALPLSSRLGMAAQPYLSQPGVNALADTVSRRRN